MEELDTFNKLKRTPLDKMLSIIENQKHPAVPRLTNTGLMGTVIENSTVYMQLMRQHRYIAELKENGWTWEDFLQALEKQTIIHHIQEFNDSIEFPQALIDHAKIFFPNIKFTNAKIELE